MSLLERIRALPAGIQVALIAAAPVLIAVVLAGLWFALRPRYEVLFSDLRPADASTIVAELERTKTPYRLEDGGAVILAPETVVDQARLDIMGGDLPLKGTVGFELFNKSDMGLTEFAQRINYQRALQGELARTIMTIDSIDTARVHLTLPEPSIFRGDRKPAEASVTLTNRPGHILTADTVAGVQRLIAASIADLSADDVVVLNAHGALVGGVSEEARPDPASASTEQRRAIEQYYEAALLRVVEPIHPDAVATVLIPLDQWGAEGDVAQDQALAQWAPGRRNFRIQVDIKTPQSLDELEQAEVARLIEAATEWAYDRGDTLRFSRIEAIAAAETRPQAATEASTLAPQTDGPPRSRISGVLGWLALMTLLFGAGLLLYLRRRDRSGEQLSQERRDAYVRRLKRLLSEDMADAA